MTAAPAGRRSATTSVTRARPARTSGTTGRRTRGSSPESGTWSRRWTTRTRSTPGWRTPGCSGPPTAGSTARPARPRVGAVVAAWRGRDVPAHDHPGSFLAGADLHGDLGRGRVQVRRRRPDLAPGEPGPALGGDPGSRGRGRPLRAPPCDAPVAPIRAVHAEALGRDAQRRRRGILARGQR